MNIGSNTVDLIILFSSSLNASLAQLVEQLSLKRFVTGSNPVWSTIFGQGRCLSTPRSKTSLDHQFCWGSLTAKTNRKIHRGSIPRSSTNYGSNNTSGISVGLSPARTTRFKNT